MHDRIGTSVRHGRDHVHEQPDTGFDIEYFLGAIAVDAGAGHVFQNEIRMALQRAGIQQPCDVRMG